MHGSIFQSVAGSLCRAESISLGNEPYFGMERNPLLLGAKSISLVSEMIFAASS